MLHTQSELVNVLQQGRRTEVEAARKSASLSAPNTWQPRLVLALSAMISGIKRPQTRKPSRAHTTAPTNVT